MSSLDSFFESERFQRKVNLSLGDLKELREIIKHESNFIDKDYSEDADDESFIEIFRNERENISYYLEGCFSVIYTKLLADRNEMFEITLDTIQLNLLIGLINERLNNDELNNDINKKTLERIMSSLLKVR